MIEASDLTSLAISRELVSITLADGGRSSPETLILWRELPTPENKITREDAWRALVRDGETVVSTIILASDATITARSGVPAAAIDPSAPVAYRDGREFTEAVALACFLGLPVAFTYQKKGETETTARRGKALGTKGPLLFLADADRAGETSSFRMDGITGFAPLGSAPRWDGAAYVAPTNVPEGW